MPHENPAAPTKLKTLERELQAMQFRRDGGTYDEVAASLRAAGLVSEGYNGSRAYRDVMSALRRMQERFAETATDVMAIEMQRLNNVMATVLPLAVAGDLFAVDRFMQLHDRILRLCAAQEARQAGGGSFGAAQVIRIEYVNDWRKPLAEIGQAPAIDIPPPAFDAEAAVAP